MARDDALARSFGIDRSPDEGVLRFYRWRRPTISFGRNEPAVGMYRTADELSAAGFDVVRRPTGGRVVLHARELTYSVCAPIAGFDSLRAAYLTINRALVAGLRRLEVPVLSAPPGPALPPDAGPCFRAPAEGEVMLGAGKLVGSAQVRIGRIILQHGSILLHDDQTRLGAVRVGEDDEGSDPHPAAALADVLGPLPAISVLVDALAGGFRETLGGDWRTAPSEGSFPPTLLQERMRHYASSDWTWRR